MAEIEKTIAQKIIDWAKKKLRHNQKENQRDLYFHEGQIWWAALGQNIGLEINGKSEEFNRPVLIIRKYNQHACFVLPLTTQIKSPSVWYQVILKEDDAQIKRAANISQGRIISTRRLLSKQCSVNAKELKRITRAFKEQFE